MYRARVVRRMNYSEMQTACGLLAQKMRCKLIAKKLNKKAGLQDDDHTWR